MNVTKTFFNLWYRWFPPPMVSYWKMKDSVLARVTRAKEGHLQMEMKGEKYPMAGVPRGFLMVDEQGDYPLFSKVKHAAKNLIFNWAWDEIGRSEPEANVINVMKGTALDGVFELFKGLKYYQLPFNRLVPAVKEFYRAMGTLEGISGRIRPLKEFLSFTMQEDDGYRYRVQWLMKASKIRRGDDSAAIRAKFEVGFRKLEDAEVTDDMKGRIRLLAWGIFLMLKDKRIAELTEKLFKELDPRKMYLTKADKFHFRAKYFKVDHERYSY